jgi:predicted GIY-YIG superfamily endonuclease
MNEYNNFVIYKIYQPENPEIFYIGSTKNFSSRKSNHKKYCNNKVSKKYKYPIYQYIRALGGWDKFTIEIYEKYPCNSKGEGLQKEQDVIDLLKPKLNSIKAIKK